MTQLEMIIALCVVFGLLALLGIHPVHLLMDAAAAHSARPRTIKRYAKEHNAAKKGNILSRQLRQVTQVLKDTGRESKVDFYQTLSFNVATGGFIIGLLTGNEFLPVVLAVLGYFLPQLFILFTAGMYWEKMNDTLHDGLKRINAAFQRSGVFMLAVRQNLDTLAEPLKTAMDRFNYDVSAAGFDKATALVRLKDRINHPTFRMWCDAAIRCLDDPSRYSELDCIETMVEDNEIKDRLDATIQTSIATVLLFMAMAVLTIPFLYMTFPELASAILTSLPGKIVVAVLVILIFYGLLTIVHVSRPIRLKEGDK